jgi:hypothetical protein
MGRVNCHLPGTACLYVLSVLENGAARASSAMKLVERWAQVQRGKDLPGGSTVPGFIATGDFASDDRRAQLALG